MDDASRRSVWQATQHARGHGSISTPPLGSNTPHVRPQPMARHVSPRLLAMQSLNAIKRLGREGFAAEGGGAPTLILPPSAAVASLPTVRAAEQRCPQNRALSADSTSSSSRGSLSCDERKADERDTKTGALHEEVNTAAVEQPITGVPTTRRQRRRKRKRHEDPANATTTPTMSSATAHQQPARPLSETQAYQGQEPTLSFHLNADFPKTGQRSRVTPREVADIALWSIPFRDGYLPVDAPRWAFLKCKPLVSHVIVVYVNGISYEQLTAPTPIGTAILGSLRCGAFLQHRSATELGQRPVEVSPLWVPSINDRLELDFFFRHEKIRKAEMKNQSHQQLGTKHFLAAFAAASSPPPEARCSPALSAHDATAQQSSTAAASGDNDRQQLAWTEQEAALWAEALEVNCPLTPRKRKLGKSHPEVALSAYVLSQQDLLRHGFDVDDPTHAPLVEPSSDSSGNKFEFAVALDCEMVLTNDGLMLGRVSVVRVPDGTVLLDTFVRPTLPVIDYLTAFSGLTEEILAQCEFTLLMAQAKLLSIISTRTFVLGHALENDFRACKIRPSCRIVDTSALFPHPNGLPSKNSLRNLVFQHLNHRIIQTGADGHDSIEDATVCIELVFLKLKHGPSFGRPSRHHILQTLADCMNAVAKQGPSASANASTSSRPLFSCIAHLIDRPDTLRKITPNQTGQTVQVHASCCHSDEAATHRAVHVLQQMGKDGMTSPAATATPQLAWVQLRDCDLTNLPIEDDGEIGVHRAAAEAAIRRLTAEQCAEQPSIETLTEGLHDEGTTATAPADDPLTHAWVKVLRLNLSIGAIVNAAPHRSVVLLMAAACKNTSRTAVAHGAVFGFVKNTERYTPLPKTVGELPGVDSMFDPAEAIAPQSEKS